MPWYLCDVVGSGADAENNARRPVLASLSEIWGQGCYNANYTRVICKAAHQAAFDSDPRIRPMRKNLLIGIGATDDGEIDDAEAPDLALKITKRFLLSQILGADDFGVNLSTLIGDIPVTRRQRIATALQTHGVSLVGLRLTDSVADGLRLIFPQLKAQVEPGPMSPSGTFTDNFNGAGATTDLGSWTPSGGTAWTLTDGTASWAQVNTSGLLNSTTTDSLGAGFQCDDQSSANHYTQAKFNALGAGASGFICNRISNRSNYIGARLWAATPNRVDLFSRSAGTFAQLGTNASEGSAGDTIRVESNGSNAHSVYRNGALVSGPSGTSSVNSTVTRQGLNARAAATTNWLDDFEAGLLAVSYISRLPLLGVGS